ncbi:MAG: DNA translocase FtsK [Proteobacteria bacterium]|nr:DNA translocase FtsK [Pseudomonadota bacterium]
MDTNQLIGRVAAAYLFDRLDDADATSTARYLLDSLSAEQTAAIARAVLEHSALADKVEIKLPAHWLHGFGLPEDCLTSERATYFRNADCAKPALLIATPGDDERQSLAELTVIDTPMLRAQVELWVRVASASLGLTDQQSRMWTTALFALQEVAQITLERFAKFVLRVRQEFEDGRPFPDVIGYALPTLQWPRNPGLFRSLHEKTYTHTSKWKQLFTQVQRRQACYLRKQTPSNQPLSADDLSSAFDKVKDVIPDDQHPTVLAFIAAPGKWNAEAEALSNIDWELIKPLFDGLKPEKFDLGRNTLQFFDEREGDDLTDDEREYLETLSKRKSSDTHPEDTTFYRAHRVHLKDEPHLKSKWDKFVFGTAIETHDFLAGLAMCLQSLFDQNLQEGTKRELRITTDRRSKADLRKINIRAGRFFAFRYRGLKALLGGDVFDVGPLLEFDTIQREWAEDKSRKYKPNESTAKANLEIKFFVTLSIDEGRIESQRQLIWRYSPEAIADELFADWERIGEHPFTACEVAREPIGPKGQTQPLDLTQARTFAAAFGQDRGSLVPVYRKQNDLQLEWQRNLKECQDQGLASAALAGELSTLFDTFARSYTAALSGFLRASVAAEDIGTQYAAYGSLVQALTFRARGDRLRDLLLKPVMRIGVVQVAGGQPTTIVAPWHPMRLQAIASKATRMANVIRTLLTADSVLFGDPALYFKEMMDELQHPYYPELTLGWRERKPELLSLTDSLLDYSLHELPLRGEALDAETNENPVPIANEIVELLQRYLALFPHEKANLSAVLYNCDSASLPQAVVDRINVLHEDEEDMRCEVVLRHRDRDRLHRLYERIIEVSDVDSDDFVASEASRDFMARLRIGIMAEEAPVPEAQDGPSKDVVFLHDVISRHAVLEWYRETSEPVALEDLVPSRWSRRRPSPRDEEKSIVYLCCPVQTKEGWDYVTAISSFFRPDWDADATKRYLPARQLDFHDPNTSKIFEETHNLGNWVVNFDELLDRRQLVNQGVRVIRYKQSATQGRNLLVSSNASLGLLQTMLISRIRDLAPELADERVAPLAKRFIDDANLISGDLVLRAAKRGRNASELIGVVLSHYLVRHELGREQRLGSFFLDDYSDWLGQSGERIADLMMLMPELGPEGGYRLTVVVTESKYVTEDSLSEQRKESQRQLRDTVRRIDEALFGEPPRLDRDLWLSRFSDLLVSGIPYASGDSMDLIRVRRAVRSGFCPVFLRGYSHVFVSGPAGGNECSDFVRVADCPNSFQECYSREKTRALLLAYESDADAARTRGEVAEMAQIQPRTFKAVKSILGGPAVRTFEPSKTVERPVVVESAPPVKAPVMAHTAEPSRSASVAPGPDGSPPPGPGATGAFAYTRIDQLLGGRESLTGDSEEDAAWLKRTVVAARSALQQFQMNSKLVGEPRLTPNAAIIRFQGAANMTVELVQRRRSELLTTFALDVISVRGEPGVVSISIARPTRRVLHALDLWKSWNPDCQSGNQKLLIATKEDDGAALFVSPTENAPHTLIAGATGSGKSVLMQNIILSIASTNTPEQARIILIDPKMGVDYFPFDGLPHLTEGVIDNQERAIAVLNGLLIEMDRRYQVLRANKCQNIFELNRKVSASERLPCLWIVHDEFAEWMMVEEYADVVSQVVSRLGVKARAAGIFLIFAAQRPDNQVMPMQLRSNLGNRLILRVDSEGTSEIALGGERGAERLLGRGHMAAKLEGHQGLVYCQVPLLSTAEISQVVGIIRADSPSAQLRNH